MGVNSPIKTSHRMVNQFELVAGEDLSLNRMMHNHGRATSIADAAWSQFAALLSYTAAWAGRRFVVVNPAYTSQECSSRGHGQTLSPADRSTPDCGVG